MSVMLTRVLLKVARMLAMPLLIFLAPLALTIFLPAISSASNSAAVGAATAAAGAPGTAGSPGLGASAAGAAPSAGGAVAFFGPFAGASSLGAFAGCFSAA